MTSDQIQEFQTLFDVLSHHSPHLIPCCRWLALGDKLARALLVDHPGKPTKGELTELLELLSRQAPQLLPLARFLLSQSEHGDAAEVSFQLGLLVDAKGEHWQHPTQILDRPRANFESLLRACIERRQRARGKKRRHLMEVEEKLERATRIAESARRRRLKKGRSDH